MLPENLQPASRQLHNCSHLAPQAAEGTMSVAVLDCTCPHTEVPSDALSASEDSVDSMAGELDSEGGGARSLQHFHKYWCALCVKGYCSSFTLTASCVQSVCHAGKHACKACMHPCVQCKYSC